MDFTTPSICWPFFTDLSLDIAASAAFFCSLRAWNFASRSASFAAIASISSALGGGFIVSEMRPFSESMDLIHTVTSCSSDTTSDTFSTKPLVSSEMCTSPSFFAPKSTKHPYSWTRFCVRECAREERATRGVRTRGVRLT